MSNNNHLFYYTYNGNDYGVLHQDDKNHRLTVEELSTGETKQISSDWLTKKLEALEVELSMER